MSSMDKAIGEHHRRSEIERGSQIYDEIFRGLTDLGLNLAFFVFASSRTSHCARTLEDGRPICLPVLTLYLKYDRDVGETGIDPHLGNWNDRWAQTAAARTALNAVLTRHNYGPEYISDHTFVFVDSLERIAFLELGKRCKSAVSDLVRESAPGVKIYRVYWTSDRIYHVILEEEGDLKRLKAKVKLNVERALPKILQQADTDRYCRSYDATIAFGDVKMNLFHLEREDL